MRLVEHQRYVSWNTRISLYWLTRPVDGEHVYLTVTPSSLATAAWECDGVPLTPEEAEQDFVAAVREMYSAHVIQERNDISTLGLVYQGLPVSIAFLALSVLAAHHMRDDGERRSTAYFPRLAELLGAGDDEPPYFSRENFEELWKRASDWTSRRLARPLYLPSGSLRRFEAYPIAHAALRRVDLERLPTFFDWAEYAPGATVALDTIRQDLVRWLDGNSTLTPRGRQACREAHQASAVQQIAVELRSWNGLAPDSSGRGVAQVDIALDVQRGIPHVFYLARRPPGFPPTFVHGEHRFDSLSDGWYEPLSIPRDDGPKLVDGFQWVSTQETPASVLKRAPSKVIALAPSEDSAGLVSRRRLLAGVDCALLFHESIAACVQERVAQLTRAPVRWMTDPQLPHGWRAVDRIRITEQLTDTLPGLEALEVDSAVELVVRGGLRVGRRAEWLAAFPPSVYVSGVSPEVTIDGDIVRVAADGHLEWRRQAMTPGEHLIVAGRSCKRISLVEARLAPSLPSMLQREPMASYPVGLAKGGWTLLGESTEATLRLSLSTQQVVDVPFEPVWALSNSCALFLLDRQAEPQHFANANAREWMNSILEAARRDVAVATISPGAAQDATRSWSTFRIVAERIERQVPAPGDGRLA